MAEGIIAVIGEAPSTDDEITYCFVPEVSSASGGRIVVVTHTVVPDKIDTRIAALDEQAYKLRRRQLMGYLRSALDQIPDTPKAIQHAFSRMNSELENIFKGSSYENLKYRWLCQYRSIVVVVGSAHVYVAGGAMANVILSRAGKDKRLTDWDLLCELHGHDLPLEKITDLCYYNKERLTEDDKFLIICTCHTLVHVDGGDLTPVLTTRVAAFGLVEAAKQIAGEYADHTRTFVIVPLQGRAELCIKQKAEADFNYLRVKKYLEEEEKLLEETLLVEEKKTLEELLAEESEPGKLGWVNSLPIVVWTADDEEMAKEGEEAMKEINDYYEEHPEEKAEIDAAMYDALPTLTGLKPLENGQRQTPEPCTWCDGKSYRYSASIIPQHIRVMYGGFELDLLSVVEWNSRMRYLLEAIGLPEHPLANRLCKAAKAEGSILFLEVYGFYKPNPMDSYPHYRACVAADQKTFEALVAATDRLAFWDDDRCLVFKKKTSHLPFGYLGPASV